MRIVASINDAISVSCPTCGYHHSVVSKFYSRARTFNCRKCFQEWDLCPDKETALQIDSDLAKLKECFETLKDISRRYGCYEEPVMITL